MAPKNIVGVLFLATLAPLASTIPTESIPVEVQGPQPKPLQAETRPPKHSLAYRSTPEEIQSGKLTPLEFMQMIAPVEFYKGEPPPEMAALMESQKNRTDAANAKLLDKRQTIVIFSPYKCPDRQTFRRATCNEEGLNQIETHCLIPGTYPNGDRRINHVTPCEDLICVPRYLGDNPEKAACVSLIVLLHEWTKNGGSKECTGINNKHLQDQQVHVITLAFHNGKGYVPEEIELTDGKNQLVQTVGPADMQGGQFVSKFFKYIGGIKECLTTATNKLTPRVDFYSTVLNARGAHS